MKLSLVFMALVAVAASVELDGSNFEACTYPFVRLHCVVPRLAPMPIFIPPSPLLINPRCLSNRINVHGYSHRR